MFSIEGPCPLVPLYFVVSSAKAPFYQGSGFLPRTQSAIFSRPLVSLPHLRFCHSSRYRVSLVIWNHCFLFSKSMINIFKKIIIFSFPSNWLFVGEFFLLEGECCTSLSYCSTISRNVLDFSNLVGNLKYFVTDLSISFCMSNCASNLLPRGGSKFFKNQFLQDFEAQCFHVSRFPSDLVYHKFPPTQSIFVGFCGRRPWGS